MLSRYPISEVESSALEQITSIDTEDLFPIDFRKIAAAQMKNKDIQDKLKSSKYELKKIDRIDLITCDGKIVLTYDIFMHILAWYHLHLNHSGTTRTYHSLASQFYIPNMEALVRAYIAKCAICKKHKHHNHKYGKLPLPDVNINPWEVIQVDLFGPWSFTDLNGIDHKIQGCSIIDIGTRWPELKNITNKTSENIAMIVNQEWLSRYPRPRA